MKIAFFTNKPYDKCETFIKAQIDRLPFDIVHYWGNNLPFNVGNNDSIVVKTFKKLKLIKRDNSTRLHKELQKNKVKVVVAQYGMIGAKLLLVCKELSLPLVVHFHGHDAVRKSVLEAYKASYKAMFNYEKVVVISVSKEMTKRLMQIGCPKEKIVYNPYGPNPDFLNLELNYLKPQFIGVGRFVEKKAPHLTILAFYKVLKKHPEAKLVLAGTGVLLDSCKDLVEALEIQHNVFFAGQITPLEYQKYITESLAFVQHSIKAQDNDMEGTPVAILEAGGAGLPVISTSHAGIPDVILNNETGLLCVEKDIVQMAENMIWMLDNKQQAMEMGKKGKLRVSELFSMDRYISNLSVAITSISK
ncbi:glycosyltransferase family 4 protein [Thalassobellus sediminis]|uniref:glycosyltransferase family 4 protein n=1 Tax=Thalassobellus sediminis TaxID=3367753 RepID=UPI0037B65FA8